MHVCIVRDVVSELLSENLLAFDSNSIGISLLKSISLHRAFNLLLSIVSPILANDELHDFANDFLKSSVPCDLFPEQCIVNPSLVISLSQSNS